MKTESEKENEMSTKLRRRKVCENMGESSTVSPPNYSVALDEIKSLIYADPSDLQRRQTTLERFADLMLAIEVILADVGKGTANKQWKPTGERHDDDLDYEGNQ